MTDTYEEAKAIIDNELTAELELLDTQFQARYISIIDNPDFNHEQKMIECDVLRREFTEKEKIYRDNVYDPAINILVISWEDDSDD